MMSISKFSRDSYSLHGDALHSAQFQLAHRRFEALLQALSADLFEVAVNRVACGNGKLRKGIVDGLQLEVAALGNLHGALRDSGRVREQARHLVGSLDEELVGVKAEAFGVVNLRPGLHAEHHVVRMRIFAAEVVRIVGEDEGNVEFLFEAEQVGLNLLLLFEALILKFEIEVAAAKDVLILKRGGLGFLVAACAEFLA